MENLIKIATNPYVLIISRCLPVCIMIVVLFIMKPKVGSLWDYHGRMGRKKYIIVWCITVLVAVIPCLMVIFYQALNMYLAIVLIIVIAQVAFFINFITTIKRLHDLNLPGWIFFIQWGLMQIALQNKILSYIGIAFTSYLFIKRGSKNANKYGENPLNKLQEE